MIHPDLFEIVDNKLIKYYGTSPHVVIPEGVVVIESYAFSNNKMLDTIEFADTVERVGDGAFLRCVNLKKVSFSKNIDILGIKVFGYCRSLKKLELPDSLERIPPYTFSHCDGLESVVIGGKVKAISMEAFLECINLKSVVMGDGVEYIWDRAFSGCYNLESIRISAAIKEIANNVFFLCNKLKRIDYVAPTQFPNGKKPYVAVGAFRRSNLSSDASGIATDFIQILPPSTQTPILTSILDHWEEQDEVHKQFLLKMAVKKIAVRNLVLNHCTPKATSELLSLCRPLDLSELNSYIQNSIQRTSVENTAILLDYKNKLFSSDEVEEFETRREMVEMGFEAPSLKEIRENWKVHVEETHLVITGYRGTSQTATLPAYTNKGKLIASISTNDYSLRNLKSLTICDGVQHISHDTFCGGEIEEINLPQSLTKIGFNAFYGSNIREVALPEDVTFGEGCFSRSKLESIRLPNSLKCIPYSSFCGCRQLKDVQFPPALEIIKANAFQTCTSLERVEFPPSLIEIEYRAFICCENLTEIVFAEGLKHIRESAFGRTGVSQIYIPDSIENIGRGAFFGCFNLTQVSLPAHLSKKISKEDLFASAFSDNAHVTLTFRHE